MWTADPRTTVSTKARLVTPDLGAAIVLAFAACHPATTPPVPANLATPTLQAHVPFTPCPAGGGGVIDHELFRGCAPAPFHEPVAPCPHGDCPRPCRVQLVGGGTQNVTYDARGRLVLARGDEDRLLDQECAYDDAGVAECHQLFEGRAISTEKTWRDASGHIIGTSDGREMVGYDPHYSWAHGHVVTLDSTMQHATFTYAGERLTVWDQEDMGEQQRITFTYDRDGDVIASSRDGAYGYDARKRLVLAGKTTLEWDEHDRLIRSTSDEASYAYSYDCK